MNREREIETTVWSHGIGHHVFLGSTEANQSVRVNRLRLSDPSETLKIRARGLTWITRFESGREDGKISG